MWHKNIFLISLLNPIVPFLAIWKSRGIFFPQIFLIWPLFYLLNSLVFPLIVQAPLLMIGPIMGLVYSTIARVWGSPDKIFRGVDPNRFQLNAIILWTIFFWLIL